MPPELGPFLWTKKTRLANHSKLIGGASDPARLELKVDGSFDLDDRGHSPSGRRYADPSYVGTPPFHLGGYYRFEDWYPIASGDERQPGSTSKLRSIWTVLKSSKP